MLIHHIRCQRHLFGRKAQRCRQLHAMVVCIHSGMRVVGLAQCIGVVVGRIVGEEDIRFVHHIRIAFLYRATGVAIVFILLVVCLLILCSKLRELFASVALLGL